MDQFDVYVAGFSVDDARATRGMMQAFGLSEVAARIFVQSVPRMAKRRITGQAADRYVRTLRAIGAVVDCRSSRPSQEPLSGHPSLPVPAQSMAPAPLRSSVGNRFSMPPAPMPVIPRAPRMPVDLAPRPASSEYPADLAANVSLELAPTHSRSTPGSSARPERDHFAPIIPDHVGISQTFAPSRPGSSLRASASSFAAPPPRWHENRTGRSLVICVVLGAVFYAYSAGLFHAHHSRRETVWLRAGLHVGENDEVRHFLAQAGNAFEGLSNRRLSDLLAGLQRAGAPRVWVIEIDKRGGARVSSTLLVELPKDAANRRTIFFQHARGAGAIPPEDVGQAFLRIAF